MAIDLEQVPLQTPIAELLSEPLTREALARYAEASGDLNPLHLDPDFARLAGFDDVIVHGMLAMAVLGRVLSRDFPAAALRSFEARFAAVVPLCSRLLCRAYLQERSADEALLRLEAVIEASGVVALTGSARVALKPSS